jgi:hypothetical protein
MEYLSDPASLLFGMVANADDPRPSVPSLGDRPHPSAGSSPRRTNALMV